MQYNMMESSTLDEGEAQNWYSLFPSHPHSKAFLLPLPFLQFGIVTPPSALLQSLPIHSVSLSLAYDLVNLSWAGWRSKGTRHCNIYWYLRYQYSIAYLLLPTDHNYYLASTKTVRDFPLSQHLPSKAPEPPPFGHHPIFYQSCFPLRGTTKYAMIT